MMYVKTTSIDEQKNGSISEVFIELDQNNKTNRLAEVMIDGFMVSSSKEMLSSDAIPSIEEINYMGNFKATEISKEEFENIWSKAEK